MVDFELIKHGGLIGDELRIENILSTTLLSGGIMSITAPGVLVIQVASGKGVILDNHTDVSNPVLTDISWTNFVDFTISTPGNIFTFIYIDINGDILESLVEPTSKLRRENILLGKVFTTDLVTINGVVSKPNYTVDGPNQFIDVWTGLGPVILSGNRISPNGVNLSIDKSVGDYHQMGVNVHADPESPNIVNIPAAIPQGGVGFPMVWSTQDGFALINRTVLDVGNYDVGGTITPIPGSNFRAQNMRVYLFSSGFVSVQFGQNFYNTIDLAVAAVESESFIVENNNNSNGILVSIISVRKGAADLSLTGDAIFLNASKFGEITGGTGGSSSSTLQAVYNNSTSPEIVVDSTRGALTIQDNASPIGANLFEVNDNSPANVFSVDVNGPDASSYLVGGTQVISAQATAIADVSTTFDPGNGTIAALSFSATVVQAEAEALRDECEKLRDWNNEILTQFNDLLAKLRTHGIINT